jgi:hypothetical protein
VHPLAELLGGLVKNGASLEHTLHWMDVVIFIFACVYVLAAFYILLLVDVGTNFLAVVDARNVQVLIDSL